MLSLFCSPLRVSIASDPLPKRDQTISSSLSLSLSFSLSLPIPLSTLPRSLFSLLHCHELSASSSPPSSLCSFHFPPTPHPLLSPLSFSFQLSALTSLSL